MTAKARSGVQVLQELQLALSDAQVRLPELLITDTDTGELRINLGRVGIGTAAKLAGALRKGK
ncbi:hypothetical protein [Streptomyces natalensis]|uniref:hypothetical protein n=1 Tax=Streptomyces natalensis TaxID=68242 RepID=UPI000AA41C68|nr:hypothetical protein [Streptomyces natalensis]